MARGQVNSYSPNPTKKEERVYTQKQKLVKQKLVNYIKSHIEDKVDNNIKNKI